jgi:hypothetical protein
MPSTLSRAGFWTNAEILFSSHFRFISAKAKAIYSGAEKGRSENDKHFVAFVSYSPTFVKYFKKVHFTIGMCVLQN